MNRTHWIRDANVGPTKIVTHCGMRGWRDRVKDEYLDESGDRRFEAITRQTGVTCKRCLRSMRRIAEERN